MSASGILDVFLQASGATVELNMKLTAAAEQAATSTMDMSGLLSLEAFAETAL
jgi:hypothetical protein